MPIRTSKDYQIQSNLSGTEIGLSLVEHDIADANDPVNVTNGVSLNPQSVGTYHANDEGEIRELVEQFLAQHFPTDGDPFPDGTGHQLQQFLADAGFSTIYQSIT